MIDEQKRAKYAEQAANQRCRCFKCDGIRNDTHTKCGPSHVILVSSGIQHIGLLVSLLKSIAECNSSNLIIIFVKKCEMSNRINNSECNKKCATFVTYHQFKCKFHFTKIDKDKEKI